MMTLEVSEKSIKKGVIFLSYLKKCTLKNLSNNLLKIRKYYKPGIYSRLFFAIFIWWLCSFATGIFLYFQATVFFTRDFVPCDLALSKQAICDSFGGTSTMYFIYMVSGFYAFYLALYFVFSFPGVLISLLFTIAYIYSGKKSLLICSILPMIVGALWFAYYIKPTYY